ncbi:MAG TPA: hypothetical protein VHJ38_14300 [Nitrososphaeraceae archaeon]|nr:hypothetical protein [Nitrososphaeraceae archaeon]
MCNFQLFTFFHCILVYFSSSSSSSSSSFTITIFFSFANMDNTAIFFQQIA